MSKDIAFIESNPNLSWLEQMYEIYQNHDIYRTIIIVDDRITSEFVEKELSKDLFAIYTLGSANYNIEYQDFLESGKRVLILEYEDYKRSQEDLMRLLMDQHNLLILENLERFQEVHVLDFINSSIKTGFLKFLPYRIWIN